MSAAGAIIEAFAALLVGGFILLPIVFLIAAIVGESRRS